MRSSMRDDSILGDLYRLVVFADGPSERISRTIPRLDDSSQQPTAGTLGDRIDVVRFKNEIRLTPIWAPP